MKYRLIIVIVGLLLTNTSYSQNRLVVKSNLLYDATGTISIGGEYALSENTTLDLSTSFNLWEPKHSREKRLNHILLQPEYRYWLYKSFKGHFFGAHAHYAYYNVGGDNWLLNSASTISTSFDSDIKNHHFKGWLLGAGVSYGYHWILHKRWSLEPTIGFGYAYMNYEKYQNAVCGKKIKNGKKHYFGPTKIGVTLIFMIK